MREVKLLVEALGDRIKVFSDVVGMGAFLFKEPPYDFQAVEEYIRQPRGLEILCAAGRIVQEIPFPPWCDIKEVISETKTKLDSQFRAIAKAMGVKFVDFMQTLRVATTGQKTGMDMYTALLLLGQEKTLERLQFTIWEFILCPESEPFRAIRSAGTDVFKKILDIRKGQQDMAKGKNQPGTVATAAPVIPSVPHEEIEKLAYSKWEKAGYPPGDGQNFWLEAEQELKNKKKK
jgi:hypothetical protein